MGGTAVISGSRLLRSMAGFAAIGAAVFLLLELSARLLIFGVAGLDPRRVGILRDLDPGELVTYETEPDLVYEYKPHLDLFFKGVRFRTNSRGMRDQEYALAKPAGTFRVAVIGSSFTLPVGVEIEDAYHSRLEESCSRELAPTRCEFLNFAVGMHGPSQFLAMLRHRALPFDPDLVLLALTSMSAPQMISDFRDVPSRHALRLLAPTGPRSYLVKLIRSRLGLQRPALADPPLAFPAAVPKDQQVVSRLGEISRASGIPIVVVRLELDATPPSPVERVVEERIRSQGMFYVDTRAAFRNRDPREFWINELDPHPNRQAHEIFAAVLEEFLRSHGLLGRSSVPGEKTLSGSRTRKERSAVYP
jgi:hypothetical protein